MQFRQRLLRVVLVGVFYESVSPRFTLQGARLVEEIIHLGDLAAFAKDLDEGVSCRNEKGCDGGRPVSAGGVVRHEGRWGGVHVGTHSSTVGERLPMNSRQGSIGPVREAAVMAVEDDDDDDDAVAVGIGATVVR